MFYPEIPPPSFPREPQVLLLRFMEWFHTGWGFQLGVLNPHGSVAQTTMLSAFSRWRVSSAHLQKHHHHCFRLFPLILSAAVLPASSLKSTCIFNVCFVSDKIMSHVAFIALSIVLKWNLRDTECASYSCLNTTYLYPSCFHIMYIRLVITLFICNFTRKWFYMQSGKWEKSKCSLSKPEPNKDLIELNWTNPTHALTYTINQVITQLSL